MPTASLSRRLLALASGNRLARGYLAVFAVSFAAMLLFPESVVATAPLLLTAPLSFLGVFLPLGTGVTTVVVFAGWLLLCALVNAAVLGSLAARTGTGAPTGAGEPRTRRLRALLAPAVDNWLARGYLAVVAVALGFFVGAALVLPDAGLAGVWPLLATAPFGFLAVAVSSPLEYLFSAGWPASLAFSLGVVVAGLFNAVLLGRLARRLRAREPRPAA
ncbi:SCO4225 family membrane protein [Streptomyces sp. NPDC085529]|uniref:SCO4225 family membrane protein n=1 Tax=Streptomyces sp. NPDC085529 TaxID=3365729 RepID=UPI0037CF2269